MQKYPGIERLFLGLTFLLAGCASWESDKGIEPVWRQPEHHQWSVGKTTDADVIQALGPPSQIIALDKQNVFYYMREKSKGQAYIFILWNRSEQDVDVEPVNVGMLLEKGDAREQAFFQAFEQVIVGGLLAQLPQSVFYHLGAGRKNEQKQTLFIAKVLVHRPFGNAHLVDQRVDARSGVTFFAEFIDSGPDDSVLFGFGKVLKRFVGGRRFWHCFFRHTIHQCRLNA